jgi:hypothetical protein
MLGLGTAVLVVCIRSAFAWITLTVEINMFHSDDPDDPGIGVETRLLRPNVYEEEDALPA